MQADGTVLKCGRGCALVSRKHEPIMGPLRQMSSRPKGPDRAGADAIPSRNEYLLGDGA